MPVDQKTQTTTAETTTDDAPPPVTREDLKQVQDLANGLGATLRKEREAAAKERAELTKRLDEIAARFEQTHVDAPAKGDKADRAAEIAQAKYDARIKELEAKAAEAERKSIETESKRLASEERQALAEGLTSLGIDSAKQRAAIALLYGEDHRIARDDAGSIGFRVKRGSGANTYDDIVSLEDGLREWASTDEGKSFLPPRGATGGGTVPGKASAARKGPKTKEEAKAEAMRQLIPALAQWQNR
jgi:hypothetical protein